MHRRRKKEKERRIMFGVGKCCLAHEKKNGEGKGKYSVWGEKTEKEKEENFWIMKIFFRQRKIRMEKENIMEKKNCFERVDNDIEAL